MIETRSIVSFFIIIILSTTVHAQDIIWTGAVDSSWHNASNWNTGSVPTSNNVVKIRNTPPYPVITANVTIKSIVLSDYWSGGTLTLRNNSTLTVTDDVTLNGEAQFNIVNGHFFHSASSSGKNNFSLNGATTRIDIENGSFQVGRSDESIDAEIIGSFYAGNGLINFFGDLDISDSDHFYVENAEVNIKGDALINGTYHGEHGNTTFENELEVKSGGHLTLESGELTMQGVTSIGNNGTASLGSGTVTILQDITVSSGGYLHVQDANLTVSGDANFTSNGNLTTQNGSISITGNASLSSGGSLDLNNGSLNIGGDASFTSGGVVNAGHATIELKGDFTVQNGSNFNPDSSTVVFSGSSEQTIHSNDDVTFYNVVVDSGAVLNTDGGNGNTIIIENDLVVEDGGEVEVREDDQIDVQGDVEGDDAINSPQPYAVTATAPSTNMVLITFNKGLDESTAENLSNYSIQNLSNNSTLAISNVALNTDADSTIVTLTTDSISDHVTYEITMNNIESNAGRSISPNHKKRFHRNSQIIFYSRKNGQWSNSSTWSEISHTGEATNRIPSEVDGAEVIIGAGHSVKVRNTVSIQSLASIEVKSSSELRVRDGGVFNIGEKVITGAGTFNHRSGTLITAHPQGLNKTSATGNIQTTTRKFNKSASYTFNGNSTQWVGDGLPSRVANLNIDNPTSVHLLSSIEVTDTLFITDGTLVLPVNQSLLSNTKVVESGQLTIHRTLEGSRGWRLLSAPITTSFGDLLDGTITQGYSGAYYSTGSMPGDTLQPNVMYYDESYPGTDNQRWRAPSSANTIIPTGLGLQAFIFGSISNDSRYNNPLPDTLTVTGVEPDAPIALPVSFTTEADSGWNLVGNPFTTAINWDEPTGWIKTNIDQSIYIWDPETNQYKTWNGVTGDLNSGKISPFQAFWIKANANAPSLTVSNEAKTLNSQFIGKQVAIPTEAPSFSLVVSNDEQESAVHFMFDESAKIGKDPLDAYRLLPPIGIGTYIDLSTLSANGDKFSINNLPRKFGIPINIPLDVQVYKNGYSYSTPLHFVTKNFSNIPTGWKIELVDTFYNERILLNEGESYLFRHEVKSKNKAPNFDRQKSRLVEKRKTGHQRFYLQITPGDDAIGLPDQIKLQPNYPNPFNPTTNIQFELPVQEYVQLKIYDTIGRYVATLIDSELASGVHHITWDASSLSSGLYLIQLKAGNKFFTQKMTLLK